MTTSKKKKLDRLGLLRACLDEFDGRYAALRGAPDFGAYITKKGEGADELTLTEPVLVKILERVLGFRPRWTIEDAVQGLCEAYRAGRIPEALTHPRYYNIKMMQTANVEALV